MTLTSKQHGVLRRILIGAAITVVVLGATIVAEPIIFSSEITLGQRIAFALTTDLLLAIWLAFSIGRLARYRFFTPEDIDGGGLTAGTEQARILQSVLQNTIEQTVFAVLVHLIWAVLVPPSWLGAIPAASILFISGRILFVRGYRKGAPYRALGFALTFYPSVVMLLIVVISTVTKFMA